MIERTNGYNKDSNNLNYSNDSNDNLKDITTMIEANRWKLGLFILIGVFFVIGGIIFFGVSQFFTPKIEILTIFNESVDGLSVGSPVKYNGVPMGLVSKILVDHGGSISVYMELYPDSMDTKDMEKVVGEMKNKKQIKEMINKYVSNGFRCSLQLAGISGNKYIGIKKYNIYDEKYKETKIKNSSLINDNFYLPSVPSFISGAADNISKLLNQIGKVDFKQVEGDIRNNLATLHSLTDKINILLTTMDSQEVQRVLLQTTSKLDDTLDAVTELCNQISKQPNSVLRGNESDTIFP